MAAFVAMTMLRQDAESNSAPGHVLTLTSVAIQTDSRVYRTWCAQFWKAFRKEWGHVEYCGFIEWTTGEGDRSGGHRRLHSHWMIKGAEGLDIVAAQAWASRYWRKLSGAWRVELAELRTVGGVVGYLALHHEKMEQAPPEGWRGRRLRPSKGYFAEDGATRRDKAEAWLRDHRARSAWVKAGNDPEQFDGAMLARAHQPAPRLVWHKTEEVKAAALMTARRGSALRRQLEAAKRENDAEWQSEAPVNVWNRRHTLSLVDFLSIVEREHNSWLTRYRWACYFAAREKKCAEVLPV